MGIAAGVAHFADFVVERAPVAAQDTLARDDDVDFLGAGFDRLMDFFNALGEGAQAGREAGRDGGDRDVGVVESAQGVLDALVIDADCADGEVEIGDVERLDEVGAQGLAGFGAEPPDFARRVVACEGGEIDHGDGAQQPGGLMLFLDAAAGRQGLGAALRRAAVDGGGAHPAHIEGDAGVALVIAGGH